MGWLNEQVDRNYYNLDTFSRNIEIYNLWGSGMKSFNQELKDEIVAEIIKHRKQDQIIQGSYGKNVNGVWKGCAVGCAIHSLNLKKGKTLEVSSHKVYETEFGIPEILARLEERIFEGLSVEDSKTWPENFMSAIPVNVDLSLVWPKLAVFILTDAKYGVIKHAENKDDVQIVSDLYSKVIAGGPVRGDDWKASAAAANAAAHASAAYAATHAAHASAAASAASAASAAYGYAAYAYTSATSAASAASAASAYAYATSAAASAAYAYAYAYAASAASAAYFKIMADKLIEILKDSE